MPRFAVWLGLLVLSGPLLGQQPGRTTVGYRAEPIQVDGDDRDWRGVEPVRLERKSQLVETGRIDWAGPQDASCLLRLLHDGSHLYLQATIRDEGPLAPRPGETWESGDVLELFFDCDLRDGQQGNLDFDADDLQIILPLYAPDRSWVVIDPEAVDARRQRHPLGVDRGFVGIEVARTPVPGGLRVEARIPLHNLPQLRPGSTEIGFNVALGDRDPGREAYNYLVWAGAQSPSLSTANFGRLVFAGPAILTEEPAEGPGWATRTLAWLRFLLPALVVLVALLGCRWLFRSRLRGRAAWRTAFGAITALLVVSAAFLPWSGRALRQGLVLRQAEQRAAWLAENLVSLERQALTGLSGKSRDLALVALLSGEAVGRPVDYEFSHLAAIQPEALGREVVHLPRDGLSFLVYSAPIGIDPVRFATRGTVAGDRLVLAVSLPASPRSSLPQLHLRLVGASHNDSFVLPLVGRLLDWQPRPDTVVYRGQIELTQEVREIAIDTEDAVDVRLLGVCRLPRDGGPPQPMLLETASRLGVGVPTDLAGPQPRSASIVVAPGQAWSARLLQPVPGVESLWVVLEALDGEEFRATPDRAIVGRLTVDPSAEGMQPVSKALRHQIEVFAGARDANPELQRLGQQDHADIAHEWLDRDGQARIAPGFALALPAEAPLGGLRVENLGSYALQLRAVVFARPKLAGGEGRGGELLVKAGPGEVRLSETTRERLAGASFLVFRDGSLTGASGGSVASSLVLPAEIGETLRRSARTVSHDLLGMGPGAGEVWQRLDGEGWAGTALAVVVSDPDLRAFEHDLDLLSALLLGLGLPGLLVFVLEVLAPLRGLRWQLTGAVGLATLVPLGLLGLFLANLLEHKQDESQRATLRRSLEVAAGRLEEAGRLMVREAEESARRLQEEVDALLAASKGKPIDVTRLTSELRESMARARHKAWAEGSFQVVDLPHPADAERVLRVHDGDASRQLGDTALGPGSGLYLRWGRPFVGARADLEPTGRTPTGSAGLRFSQGRVLDESWVGSLATAGWLGIYDLRGYPIVTGSAASRGADFQRGETRAGPMAAKVALVERLRQSQGPIVTEIDAGYEKRLGSFLLLSDRGGVPIALLANQDRVQPAALPFFFGEIGAKPFFAGLFSLLLVVVLFLSLTLTSRISRPIESLAAVARSLARGELDVRIEPVAGADEIANLNRAFGSMAGDLKRRIAQQERMHAALSRLTAKLDLDAVAGEVMAILAEACAASVVVLLMRDRESRAIVARWPGGACEVEESGGFLALCLRGEGAFSVDRTMLAGAESIAVFRDVAVALVLPLRLQDRRLGAVVLGHASRQALDVDLEHLTALAGQAASAIETAWLYRLAIEDAATGLHVRRYFRRRLEQEVERSQRSRSTLALLRLEIRGGLRRQVGEAHLDRVLQRVGETMLAALPQRALASRHGLLAFEVMVGDCPRAEASRLGQQLQGLLVGVVSELVPAARVRVRHAIACFPEDGRSTAFLVATLDRGLRTARRDQAEEPGPRPIERGRGVFAAASMRDLLANLDRVAPTDLTVLIEGETGVGKEVLVDICHEASPRARGPLVKVNCAAIPASLLESELFGHERGAFTGAVERKRGLFELAHGGTLFLDEVAEMSLELQAKLLRVLQDRQVMRVGGESPVAVDVRLLTATHRNLGAMVRSGAFREDLFYRLMGVLLHVPPLRERKEEIPPLVELFRRRVGPGVPEVGAAALDALHRHPWPGNVRELENVIRRALLLARGRFVEPEDLDLAPVAEPAPSAPTEAAEVEKSDVEVPRPALVDLEGRWKRLTEYFAANGGAGLSPQVYRRLTGTSRRTATRDLLGWSKSGKLICRGQKRATRYFLASGGG